ncbi:MAG: hypothetical protein JWR09_5061 [Mucilaginibacter sp.]|nr:hypothetical protein [Mucilaginibacter sp.]
MAFVNLEIPNRKEKYLETIKQLRLKNFSKNLPFLILSDRLPEGQVYREFPDGHIELQETFSMGSNFGSTVLQILSPIEADQIRREYGLF